MTSYEFARPHQAFSAGFFKDPRFDFEVRGLLGRAPAGASEPGEVLATIADIKDGDSAAWHEAWLALGRRLRTLGDELREAEHFDSAAGAYLRAASYLAIAVDSGDDAHLLDLFREHRAAWDGFIDTTVYLAERVEIPYEGAVLPGYLIKPADDDELRPTVVLVSGSHGSHASMWGDAAFGALSRGYNVLLFDGPGQQSMLFERGVGFRPDWEKVLTPVVDFLLVRADVDEHRLAVYGVSQGGFWAARALAFEHRVAAAILDPGVTDVSASWFSNLPAPLVRLFDDGKREAFDRDLELGMRFSPASARDWAFRARPFQRSSPFDTLTDVRTYALGEFASKITTPLFITAAEGEQFWPGQSQLIADAVSGEHIVQPFTASEGANFHCQPLARTLTQQRTYDWLDAQFAQERP